MSPARSGSLTGGANRIYYYFVLGAMGGLVGWYFTAMVTVAGVASQVVLGGLLGASIGLGAGAFDGIACGSMARIVKFGGTSLLLGLAAGAIALPLVQTLYGSVSQADSVTRFSIGTLCWIVLGGLIGLGEGVSKGSQPWKGLLGGIIGGALGGGIYEAVGRSTASTGSVAEQSVLAFAVSTLGGFIGSSVALVTTVLKDAWLVIENGKLAGTEINISKYVHRDLGSRRAGIIGSSQWDANIYLPGDSDVLPKHASIGYRDGAPTLTALPLAIQRRAKTLVNGRPVTVWPLSNGDRLQIGSTTLQYRQNLKKRG